MNNQESIKAIPSNRLQYFPVMMFAIVMGLSGLSLVFKTWRSFTFSYYYRKCFWFNHYNNIFTNFRKLSFKVI